MNGWLIVGIAVAVIVFLIAFAWIRQIRGAKRFDDKWEKMTEAEKRQCQYRAYRNGI